MQYVLETDTYKIVKKVGSTRWKVYIKVFENIGGEGDEWNWWDCESELDAFQTITEKLDDYIGEQFVKKD